MQILAHKCERCGRIEENNSQMETIELLLRSSITGSFERVRMEVCQFCADGKVEQDRQYMENIPYAR